MCKIDQVDDISNEEDDMNTIWKFKLENIDQQTIEVPLPAKILSVVEQNDDIMLYSVVDNDKDVPKIPVDILIKGAGDFVENNIGLYTFLGTVKLLENNEIWHVFYMYADNDSRSRQTDRLGEPLVEKFGRESAGKGGLLIA
jgi:hypothetical protein